MLEGDGSGLPATACGAGDALQTWDSALHWTLRLKRTYRFGSSAASGFCLCGFRRCSLDGDLLLVLEGLHDALGAVLAEGLEQLEGFAGRDGPRVLDNDPVPDLALVQRVVHEVLFGPDQLLLGTGSAGNRLKMLLRRALPTLGWMILRETVTVTVLAITPALVTCPINARGGMAVAG
jgi:hypothetical protein